VRASSPGWIGRKRPCSPTSSTACSGHFIAHLSLLGIGRPFRAKVARCAQHFRLLDSILSDRPYLCGDTISLADLPAATSLYRYFELDIERPSVPNVEAWYQRLQSRPAYRARVMLPFEELRGRLDP